MGEERSGMEARLAVLRQAGLVAGGRDEAFDRFTRLAVTLLAAPVAQLNVITADRQISKSSLGPQPWEGPREAPLTHSYCREVVATGDPLVVADAREHPLLHDHPATTESGIVAYAAEPLVVDERHVVGTLCVVDFEPRQWSEPELAYLRDLAAAAATEIELRLDVARREETEAELRRIQLRLEDRVRERTAELEAARARIEGILESISDRFYALDREWRFTYANRNAQEAFGKRASELLGRSIWELFPAAERAAYGEHLRRALAEAVPVTFESASLVFPDRWVEVHAYPAEGGLSVFSQDITERRIAEGRLRRRESQLAEAQRLARLGSWEYDPGSDVLVGSDEAYRIFGLDPAVGELTFEWFFSRVRPDHRERVMQNFGQVLAGERTSISEEYCIVREDGEERYIHARGTVEPGADDGPARILGTVQDITEREQAEQALRRSEAQLRQAQKMEAVGRLAGGVAHDFNNVLTAIRGYSQFVYEDLGAADPLRADVLEIIQAVDRAAGIVRQLLTFSRQHVMAPELLDPNAVVRGVERMLRQLIGEDVRMSCHLEEDVWSVVADPGLLEQVLVNLAVNARDAMPEGGRLGLRTRNCHLDGADVPAKPDAAPGRYVQIVVSDTGTGIPPAIRDRIFDPFFTTKAPGKGTGLGLSTVYGIVKQAGGFIDVYSEPGQGTAFKVYLPAADGRPHATESAAQPAPAGDGSEVVLVVEDEPAVRGLVRRALERHRYTVLEAESGEAAIALARDPDTRIDLLLTDVIMPAMSGREVARRITELRPGLRVLFASGYAEDEVVHRGLLEPGIALIEKPFTPDELARRVRQVLRD